MRCLGTSVQGSRDNDTIPIRDRIVAQSELRIVLATVLLTFTGGRPGIVEGDEIGMVQPFDSYPHGGRALLGRRTGGNARWEYGLKLQRLTGQTRCAWC